MLYLKQILKAEKMINQRKTVVTMGISGSGEEEYLARFKKYAEERGKTVGEYLVGKRIFEQAERNDMEWSRDRILKAHHGTMKATKSAVFEDVGSEILSLPARDSVAAINLHGCFYKQYLYELDVDGFYINQLNPDFYIYFMNDVDSITRSLKKREQWDFLFGKEKPATSYPNYGRDRILEWQSVEYMIAKLLANGDFVASTANSRAELKKRLFVIPTKAHESILYRLIFEPWRRIYYFGMPLTLFNDDKYKKDRARIDELKAWLEEKVILVDPRYVEPLSKKHLSEIDRPMYSHVVFRDLRMLIPQCKDGMIAFFPKSVMSSGVQDELREQSELTRKTWLIYPPDRPASPFLTERSVVISRGERQFMRKFLKDLGPKYLEQVKRAEKEYS